MSNIPVMHAVGLRLFATAATLWVIALFREKAVFRSLPLLSMIPSFLILSVLGFSLYFVCSFGALKSLKASDLTMVLATIPGITYILGTLTNSLMFSWFKLIGMIIVSVAAIAFNINSVEVGYYSLIGIALALTAALSYSAYGLLSKRYLKNLPLLTSLAWITTISAVSFMPLFIFDPAPLLYLNLEDILKILILGTVCSAPVYVLYQKVLAEGGVLYANTIGVLSPFAVVTCEWIIGSSPSLNMIKIIAMIMAAIGMTLLFIDASKVSGWQQKHRAKNSKFNEEIK
ncbi:DMT family transporter [Bartonella krasnovii]|uniref:DMT family transporter n=1 Tax=Bartonella krasnovii TaxID=2267275 RepID=A0ABY3VXA9_9HYPH|nr:DMT family transporter [Bartonella krasnovii]UNF30003.1 DMT family transporter [Bartonella krasnovii]UNF36353.1 DMT family transporter [Bartonella krasnovii]UNF39759.1 DMT family transporter [Bartonella krasnovii]UNF41437.1 DMT family transporter [Bartonella krasnovii]UNF43117.1 DMT family transporter [Bartonella krasnovii]